MSDQFIVNLVAFLGTVAVVSFVGFFLIRYVLPSGFEQALLEATPLYEKRRIECPWCQPPGSGKRNVPGVPSLGIEGGETRCGDCAGRGTVLVFLSRINREKREAEEKRWGIEKREWED